jgi:hypothetical protein
MLISAPTQFDDAAPNPFLASLIMNHEFPTSSDLKSAVVPSIVKNPYMTG